MPKKGHTEEQIVSVLGQVEAGARGAEICRKVGIGEATSICGSDSIRGWGGRGRAARYDHRRLFRW